jgi:hypothetical protein
MKVITIAYSNMVSSQNIHFYMRLYVLLKYILCKQIRLLSDVEGYQLRLDRLEHSADLTIPLPISSCQKIFIGSKKHCAAAKFLLSSLAAGVSNNQSNAATMCVVLFLLRSHVLQPMLRDNA